jgi:signal transduction histidine kinase
VTRRARHPPRWWPQLGPARERPLRAAIAVALVPMLVSALWLVATSPHFQRPGIHAIYQANLFASPMVIGLLWWRRRPASRFGRLLVVLGFCVWPIAWQGSTWPLLFNLGVLAEGVAVFVNFYLLLAFPTGRLESRVERLLLWVFALGVGGSFLLWALFSPALSGGGPLASCAPACPPNVLQVGEAPWLVATAGHVQIVTAIGVALGILVVYVRRLIAANRPRRRALVGVAATSLLLLPTFILYHAARVLFPASPDTLQTLAWLLVGARILYPLGFLLVLIQAQLFANSAQRHLLLALSDGPSLKGWEAALSRALDDPALRVGFIEPTTAHLVTPEGTILEPPPVDGETLLVPMVHRGEVAAALLIDAVLADDPELISAASTATIVALQHGQLEDQLRRLRTRLLDSADDERRRIQMDLHDGAQQRLVVLRMRLRQAEELLAGDPEARAVVEDLAHDVDDALEELRNLARGIYPAVLTRYGVAAALASLGRGANPPTMVVEGVIGRYPTTVEHAAYFCCLEAMQNAAKHAGPEASVTVTLKEQDGNLQLEVHDDGRGFERPAGTAGAGMSNMQERVTAAGGDLDIDSTIGVGTTVRIRIPVTQSDQSSGHSHDHAGDRDVLT